MPFALKIDPENPPLHRIVPCVWDKKTLRYVPAESPYGQVILNTPITPVEHRRTPIIPPVSTPASVVDHPCGLSVPSDIRKDGLCGVLAVAVAAGRTLGEVYRYMARRHRGNWKGSTTNVERMNALTHYGVKYIGLSLIPNVYNVQRWARLCARPDVSYIVTTTRHVQVIRNGFVIDQQGLKIIADYWAKGKKVISVLEIEP